LDIEKLKENKLNIDSKITQIFEKDIENYKFKILKNQYDFLYYGYLMKNCLNNYFYKIKNKFNKRIVLIAEKNNKPEIAIEISFNLKKRYFKVLQKYKSYNNPVNEKELKIIKKYVENLKKI
jgi:hypothetical protein